MQVIVDNLLTSYDVSGDGPLVVLLHGWGDSRVTFELLQQELSSKYRVVSLDLPGFGQTQAPAEPWNLDNYAQFVNHFIDKLSLGQAYAVVGHSNGGALAIRGLSQGQLEAQKLVLLAASGIRDGNSIKRLTLKLVAKAGNLLTLLLPASIRQRLRARLYGAAGSDMLVVPELQETFKRTVSQDVQADARRIKIDTLLIYATGDKAVPLEHGQRYKLLMPKSKLTVIDGADHFLHHRVADRVNQDIQDFLG